MALTAAGAAIVAALVSVMPRWGAPLVVAAAALSVAVGFGIFGSRRLRWIARPPEQTLSASGGAARFIRSVLAVWVSRALRQRLAAARCLQS